MATIQSRLEVLERQTMENGVHLKKIDEALYGNGKPGLLTEFRLLREDVKRHHEEERRRVEKEDERRLRMEKQKKLDWQWLLTFLVAISSVVVAIVAIHKH